MKVSELGEFGLIDLIARTIKECSVESPPGLILGIGDDAAAWDCHGPVDLATTDTMVDGVHFEGGQISWEELGWKSLAVNLSDIAAMGGSPAYALVTLGIPPDTMAEDIVLLYRGMLDIGNRFGVTIAGGDTVRCPVTMVTVSLFGTAKDGASRMMTRSGARPGDAVAVTGFLGNSSAGLKMLQQSLSFDPETTGYLRQAHFKPQPRVAEGHKLAGAGVRCAIDVSDGLMADLAHICERSGVGARVVLDRVPVHPLVQAAFPTQSIDMALSGGEDYELLFTAGSGDIPRLRDLVSVPITVIGEITADHPSKVVLVDKEGKAFDRSKNGWDHFSRAKG